MILRISVMLVAAFMVLAFLWWRGRNLDRRTSDNAKGRGLMDEAAAAYEDVAEQVISSDPGPGDRNGNAKRRKSANPAGDA